MTNQKQPNEEQLQQMYMQLQQIDTQIQELSKELKTVDQKKGEFLKLGEDLGKLSTTKIDSKTFTNVGAGIFAEAKLTNTKDFLINVGANTYVKKPVAEVQTLLKHQSKELEKVEGQLQQNIQMLSMQAQIIQGEMQKAMGL